MTITRDQFVSAGQFKSFDVDGLGLIRIKALPVKERFGIIGKQIEISNSDAETIEKTIAITDVQIYMIAMSLVDDSGSYIFNANSKEDLDLIASKDESTLGLIVDEIVIFNKFSTKKDTDATSETAKN